MFGMVRAMYLGRVWQLAQNRSGAKENSVMKAVLSKLTWYVTII